MPAASEINACCPTSLSLPNRPEDCADGFNGLLLSMIITTQICHINNDSSFLFFFNSISAVIQLASPKHVLCMIPGIFQVRRKVSRFWIQIRRQLTHKRHTGLKHIRQGGGSGAGFAGGLLFPASISAGSVSLVPRKQQPLVWAEGRPRPPALGNVFLSLRSLMRSCHF